MTTPDDLITVTEARELLHISRSKMAELLRDGAIRQFPNPLDKREKLVSRDEVLALRPKKLEAA
jgi:predicted DNA-binding transcriptional regulator AlpA